MRAILSLNDLSPRLTEENGHFRQMQHSVSKARRSKKCLTTRTWNAKGEEGRQDEASGPAEAHQDKLIGPQEGAGL